MTLDNRTKVIYTSIVGSGYELSDPRVVCDDWKYICFTNRSDLRSNVWEVINIDDYFKIDTTKTMDARQASRIPKILFRDADCSIYIDAKFRPLSYLNTFLNYTTDNYDIGLLHHFKSKNIDEECQKLLMLKNCNLNKLGSQIRRYYNEGFPGISRQENIMYAPGIMIRKHNDIVNSFCDEWWNEYIQGVERDMISLNYLLWKYKALKIYKMRFKKTYRMFKNYPKKSTGEKGTSECVVL